MLCWSLSACQEQILHDLPEVEANRLLARLEEASIRAEKIRQSDGTWALAVSRSRSFQAIQFLAQARLLKATLPVSASKPTLMSGKNEQRFHYLQELGRALETTLSGLPDVLDVRVHVQAVEPDPLVGRNSDLWRGSASVLLLVSVRHEYGPAVAGFVAGAAGLAPERVAVFEQVASQTRGEPGLSAETASPAVARGPAMAAAWRETDHRAGVPGEQIAVSRTYQPGRFRALCAVLIGMALITASVALLWTYRQFKKGLVTTWAVT